MTAPLAKNTMNGDTPRVDNDAYYTPDALALAIARRVRVSFGDFGLVVEPSAGAGAFCRAARATWRGSYVVAIEPNDATLKPSEDGCDERWRGTWESADAAVREHILCATADEERTLVLGNPPYNLPGDGKGNKPTTAERHVLLALDRMRDGDVLAFLLRLAFAGGGGRIERLYEKHPLAALWPVTPRPSFTGGGTDASEYGVFVWVKGQRGPVDMRPLKWGDGSVAIGAAR